MDSGVATAATFQEVTRNSRASVVTILDGRAATSSGTVVAEDGRIDDCWRLPAETEVDCLMGESLAET